MNKKYKFLSKNQTGKILVQNMIVPKKFRPDLDISDPPVEPVLDGYTPPFT